MFLLTTLNRQGRHMIRPTFIEERGIDLGPNGILELPPPKVKEMCPGMVTGALGIRGYAVEPTPRHYPFRTFS